MANEFVQKLKIEIADLEERRGADGGAVRAELAADEGAGDEHRRARRQRLTVEVDGVVERRPQRLPGGTGQGETRSSAR